MQELARVLHDIDNSMSVIAVALMSMLLMSYFDCHCECTSNSEKCETVCEKKSYEQPPLEPHENNGECWCYDPTKGKSERMW